MREDTDLRLPPALQTFGADFALAMERAHQQSLVGGAPAQRRQHGRWRELVRRHTRISAGVALVALLAASAGIAEASGVLGTAQPTSPNSGQTATFAQAADPTDLAMLGILRRPQEPGDALPANGGPGGPIGRSTGANPELARRVNFGALGDAWVIPADGGVCLQGGGGGGCDTDVDGHPPYIQTLSGQSTPGVYLITGLAPDGASAVDLHLADGSVDVVPVDQNVYMTDVSSGITSTTYTDANGVVITLSGGNSAPTSDHMTVAPCAPAVDTGCQSGLDQHSRGVAKGQS